MTAPAPQRRHEAPSLSEATIAARLLRLEAAGLTHDAARLVAEHPTGGPVVLAPGVIISIFPERWT